MIAVSVVLSLVVVALFEYLGHRYPLHHRLFTRWLPLGKDHLKHHKLFVRKFEDVPEAESSYDAAWVRFLFGLGWSALVAAPFLFFLPWEPLAVFVAVATAHAVAWSVVHNQMHRPTGVWWSRTIYFRAIRRLHLGHHLKPRTNYGFVFGGLCDRLFGTYSPAGGGR